MTGIGSQALPSERFFEVSLSPRSTLVDPSAYGEHCRGIAPLQQSQNQIKLKVKVKIEVRVSQVLRTDTMNYSQKGYLRSSEIVLISTGITLFSSPHTGRIKVSDIVNCWEDTETGSFLHVKNKC